MFDHLILQLFKKLSFFLVAFSILNSNALAQCNADFTAQPRTGCAGMEVWYTDNSQGAEKWVWTFPGGTPSGANGSGPHKVTYNIVGSFDAKLEIFCQQGSNVKTKYDYITVNDCYCTADFTAQPTSGCPGLEVEFTDNSRDATSWDWSFPGGSPGNAQGKGPHKVVYNKPGAYGVTLQIVCPNGNDTKTIDNMIRIDECPCVAAFTGLPTSGDAPLVVTFTDQSTGARAWSWSFPGGKPGTAQGTGPHQVEYQSPGIFDVSLEITCDGNTDILVKDDYIHVNEPVLLYEYGDAPEGVIAYPSTGVIGRFPTCLNAGPAGYVRHGTNHNSFLGNHADFEVDGNEGLCPDFGDQYDQDESCYEADAGLWAPDAFTIIENEGVLKVEPLCEEFEGTSLGYTCGMAQWGPSINLWFDTHNPDGAFVNVLIDWNQDGKWEGSSRCNEQDFTFEHVLKNFPIPGASNGHLSVLDPPDFRIGPNPGYVWVRLTITKGPIPLPWNGSGEFSEGESEDYLIKIDDRSGLFDFGDAPFGTLLADSGAHHYIVEGIHLGAEIDAEDDGQPDAEAEGDDKKDIDDEDGVEFKSDFYIGKTAHLEITASVDGVLKAWIDYNQDKDWNDAGEMVLDHQMVAGTNSLSIAVPGNAEEGQTFARFRFSDQYFGSPHDLVENGEVEDYRIVIKALQFDFGDAPVPFPTTLDNNGARHLASELFLGESIDWEDNGTNSPNADADDLINVDDEDGIEFIPPLVPGYHFQLYITPSDSGWLNGWIDFNQDSDWDDYGEQIPEMQVAPRTDHPELANVRSVLIPEGADIGNAAMRLRLSSERDIGYDGLVPDGEVEDYILPIGAGMDSLDWGDAPDPPYPTLAIHDGARHVVGMHTAFGEYDTEPDGQPDADATGDNLNGVDDESEILFLTPLMPGDSAKIGIWPNDVGYINAWIDFNMDGDWDDADEHCLVDERVRNTGAYDTLSIYVPEYTLNGHSYGRFRIAADPGIGYTGLAIFGEVEDYKIALGDIASCIKDSLALVALYHSTNGADWENNTNWLTGPVDTWHGIEIDNCRVKRVNLINNNMTGSVPPEIGDLSAMEFLLLRDNNIGGSIPPELGNCRACTFIDISNNVITGAIPPELSQLRHLKELIIENCELTGTIPPEIGNLEKLEHLSFDSNNLEGKVPRAIYGLTKLHALLLGYNQLTDVIPPEIDNLRQLETYRIVSNMFTGSLPDELFNLSNLTYLGLWVNNFSGHLPARIGELTELEYLYLQSNEFSGPLPEELFSLTKLVNLNLDDNEFTGTISPLIGNLVNLEMLHLHFNNFTGAIPAEITELHQLEIIFLQRNQFDVLPDLSTLGPLSYLYINDNKFTFEDIEPNIHVPNFQYAPQDSIGMPQDTTVIAGSPLKLYATTSGSANHYTWVHDGVDIPGVDADVLPFTAVTPADSGKYICRITNTLAPDLTLYRRAIRVRVKGGTKVVDAETILPEKFALHQNYPNPFNPATSMQYELPEPADVRLTIYDVAGRKVRALVDSRHQPGVYNILWDATDDQGRPVAAGLYLCRMSAGNYVRIIKLAFVK